MNWTKTLPTKSGYYWWRKYNHKSESIYYVFYDLEQSIAKENLTRTEPLSSYDPITKVQPENRVFYCRWCHEGLYDKQKLEDVGGEWYGPIQKRWFFGGLGSTNSSCT